MIDEELNTSASAGMATVESLTKRLLDRLRTRREEASGIGQTYLECGYRVPAIINKRLAELDREIEKLREK